jgi:DNA-binding LytR/AlgR family response regulator
MFNKSLPVKVLIIEDDPTWSIFVESIISESKYELVGTANTMTKAKAMIEGFNPDILISEIRIQNVIVFDFLDTEKYLGVPIIFMAHQMDDRFYELSQTIPKTTYLTKPFHKFTLLSTLDLLLSKYHVKNIIDKPFISIRENQYQVKEILFDDIVWIEAERNYSIINTLSGMKYLHKKKLKECVEELDERFIRVHKGYIINKKYISQIDLTSREITVNNSIVPIGRTYRSELDSLLK